MTNERYSIHVRRIILCILNEKERKKNFNKFIVYGKHGFFSMSPDTKKKKRKQGVNGREIIYIMQMLFN